MNSNRSPGRAHWRSVACAVLLASLAAVAPAAAGELPELIATLETSAPSAADLRAAAELDALHRQLDALAGDLALRLERGEPAPAAQPALDGRAARLIDGLRAAQAARLSSPALRTVYNALADAHAERLEVLAELVRGGGHQDGAWARADCVVRRLAEEIADWRAASMPRAGLGAATVRTTEQTGGATSGMAGGAP